MHIDGTVKGLEIAIGHFEQQLLTGFHATAITRQRKKQIELGGGEGQGLVLKGRMPRLGLNPEPADYDRRSRVPGEPARP